MALSLLLDLVIKWSYVVTHTCPWYHTWLLTFFNCPFPCLTTPWLIFLILGLSFLCCSSLWFWYLYPSIVPLQHPNFSWPCSYTIIPHNLILFLHPLTSVYCWSISSVHPLHSTAHIFILTLPGSIVSGMYPHLSCSLTLDLIFFHRQPSLCTCRCFPCLVPFIVVDLPSSLFSQLSLPQPCNVGLNLHYIPKREWLPWPPPELLVQCAHYGAWYARISPAGSGHDFLS